MSASLMELKSLGEENDAQHRHKGLYYRGGAAGICMKPFEVTFNVEITSPAKVSFFYKLFIA